MDKGLKKCSTSTDVVSVHHVHKVTNPYQKANKRELDNLEIKEKRKKQKKHNEISEEMEKSEKEIEKLRKSLKEMTETIKELRLIIQTSAKRSTPFRNRDVCNFGDKDHEGNNNRTLFCRGFDISVPRHEIKRALWKHFSSCGKVKRVYVPIECATGVALGFALIDMAKHSTRGLKLDGSVLGGRILCVKIGTSTMELYSLGRRFRGCKRCCHQRPSYESIVTYYDKKPWWLAPPIVGTRLSKIRRFTVVIDRFHKSRIDWQSRLYKWW
ncbi:PREDICTED: uncharacterized protein LOC104712945 isoform X2 [Camelina sativa]|uniref:Uncharacterized protein LOC104712945 isoform X2 n=1 Tax=Camelina sativa TaxID=90675 RepID=A0ABM1QEU3_CAMSA|nr:PREDICTED: uncharacterized protein LOC104712945 isoform X2 [Camelina sativa]